MGETQNISASAGVTEFSKFRWVDVNQNSTPDQGEVVRQESSGFAAVQGDDLLRYQEFVAVTQGCAVYSLSDSVKISNLKILPPLYRRWLQQQVQFASSYFIPGTMLVLVEDTRPKSSNVYYKLTLTGILVNGQPYSVEYAGPYAFTGKVSASQNFADVINGHILADLHKACPLPAVPEPFKE